MRNIKKLGKGKCFTLEREDKAMKRAISSVYIVIMLVFGLVSVPAFGVDFTVNQTLNPGQTLSVNFTTNASIISASGINYDTHSSFVQTGTSFVDRISTNLFDGPTLLAFNPGAHEDFVDGEGVSWISTGSPHNIGNPVEINFATLLDGTIQGRLDIFPSTATPVSIGFVQLILGEADGEGGITSSGLGDEITITSVSVPEPAAVPFDIKPQSCPNPINVESKGVIPVAILGTADFDVTQVDPASVQLEGVSPLRWSLEDVATPFNGLMSFDAFDCTTLGPDGFLDLTFKYKSQEVVAALGDFNDGDVLVLMLTGNLKEEYGGTPIEGMDVVVILE
jgi:hypothetical protein